MGGVALAVLAGCLGPRPTGNLSPDGGGEGGALGIGGAIGAGGGPAAGTGGLGAAGTGGVGVAGVGGRGPGGAAGAVAGVGGGAPPCSVSSRLSFAPPVIYLKGVAVNAATLVDLNSDGRSDVAIADISTGNVSVLLNAGNGTFGNAMNTLAASVVPFLGAADMDHDGKADLILISNSAEIAVMHNNGGVLSQPLHYPAPGVSGLAVGDLDGDGLPDVAGAITGQVAVFHNSGGGALAAATGYDTAGSGTSIAMADVDGDGKPDLAVPMSGAKVRILINNGNGTFGTRVADYPVGANNVVNLAFGDLNGDGKPDLVATDFMSQVLVLMNDGTGAFGAAVGYPAGTQPFALALADLDNDGKLDVTTGDYGANPGIGVLMNTGNGHLASVVSCPAGLAPFVVQAADLNGDGKVDLFVPNVSALGTGGVYILLNNAP